MKSVKDDRMKNAPLYDMLNALILLNLYQIVTTNQLMKEFVL